MPKNFLLGAFPTDTPNPDLKGPGQGRPGASRGHGGASLYHRPGPEIRYFTYTVLAFTNSRMPWRDSSRP